jgi:hypothetical protein
MNMAQQEEFTERQLKEISAIFSDLAEARYLELSSFVPDHDLEPLARTAERLYLKGYRRPRAVTVSTQPLKPPKR